MLGAGLQFGLSRGEDRFYNPVKARRSTMENDKLRRAHSDVSAGNRVDPDDAKKSVVTPSCEPVMKRLSNLERFLLAITPSVFTQYPSKVTIFTGIQFVHLRSVGFIYFSPVLSLVGH